MNIKHKRNGFTLVELLVTIAIIGLILAIGGGIVFSIMNNSKKFSFELSEKGLIDIAGVYVKENADKTAWKDEVSQVEEGGPLEKTGNQYVCVFIDELISSGYVDGDRMKNLSIPSDSIFILRDSDKNIISEKFSTGECSKAKKVKIPKSEDICNNITYDGFSHKLNLGNDFGTYTSVDVEGTYAGNYPVTLKLKEGHTWGDDTTEDKEVICTIKKATPVLNLDPTGNKPTSVGAVEVTFSSNVLGKVSLKSSNVEHVAVESSQFDVNQDDGTGIFSKKVKINTLASRNTNTYVTFSFVPEDSLNYNNNEIVYTVGNIKQKEVAIPSCNDLVYNGETQKLIDENSGYILYNNLKVNAGEYKVKAVLKYGYKWEKDGTTQSKEFVCKIAKKKAEISVNPASGEVNLNHTISTYVQSDVVGSFEVMLPSNGNVLKVSMDMVNGNNKYYRLELKGLKISKNNEIKIKFTPNDTTNYDGDEVIYKLTVKDEAYTLTYDSTSNGGNECVQATKTVYKGKKYGELCTPTKKSGFKFIGWYTSKDNRDTKVTKDTVAKGNATIYAHYRKTVNVTLKYYSGESVKTETLDPGYIYNNDTSVPIKLPNAKKVYKDDYCTISGTSAATRKWEFIGWIKDETIQNGWYDKSIVEPGGWIYNNDVRSDSTREVYEKDTLFDFSGDGTQNLSAANVTLYALYRLHVMFLYDYNNNCSDRDDSYVPTVHYYMYRNAAGGVLATGNPSWKGTGNKKPVWVEVIGDNNKPISGSKSDETYVKRNGCTFKGWKDENGNMIITYDRLEKGETKTIEFDCNSVMISAGWNAGCSC